MSVYGLALEGWDARSVWGWDDQLGSYYAALTRNGRMDSDRPDVWIAPGRPFPVIVGVDLLAPTVAAELGMPDVRAIYDAMNVGAIAAGGPPPFPIPGSGQPGSTAPGRDDTPCRSVIPDWTHRAEPQVREVHRVAAAWYQDDPSCVRPGGVAAALDWVLAGGPAPVSRHVDQPTRTRVMAEAAAADNVVQRNMGVSAFDGGPAREQKRLVVVSGEHMTHVLIPPAVVQHHEWVVGALAACAWITSMVGIVPLPLPIRPAPSQDDWFRALLADADEATRRDPQAIEQLWRSAEASFRGNARLAAYAQST